MSSVSKRKVENHTVEDAMISDILLITVILFVLDMIYISTIAPSFKTMILNVQAKPLKANYFAAALCYILLVLGLYYFIVQDDKPLIDAFLFGVILYGVYETTNMATLVDWQWKIVMSDTIWGGLLMTLTYYILKQVQSAPNLVAGTVPDD